MNCKNCGQELAEDEIICAQCGQDNSPEVEAEPKKRIDPWKIAFPAVVGLCLFLVLAWLLNFGVTGELLLDRLFKENNVRYKESYSAMTGALLEVTHDQVVAKLGEHKLTNGQLRMFYSVAKGDWKGKYKSNIPLDEQIYDEKTGLTWEQYLLELSLNTWKQYRIVTDMAKDEYMKIALDALTSSGIGADSFYLIPGNSVRGKEHDEFYADMESTIPLMLELFFREVS